MILFFKLEINKWASARRRYSKSSISFTQPNPAQHNPTCTATWQKCSQESSSTIRKMPLKSSRKFRRSSKRLIWNSTTPSPTFNWTIKYKVKKMLKETPGSWKAKIFWMKYTHSSKDSREWLGWTQQSQILRRKLKCWSGQEFLLVKTSHTNFRNQSR